MAEEQKPVVGWTCFAQGRGVLTLTFKRRPCSSTTFPYASKRKRLIVAQADTREEPTRRGSGTLDRHKVVKKWVHSSTERVVAALNAKLPLFASPAQNLEVLYCANAGSGRTNNGAACVVVTFVGCEDRLPWSAL